VAKKLNPVSEVQLARYEELGEQIELLKAEQDAIKALCEKQGSFELGDFKVTVSDIVSDRANSVEVLSKKLKMTTAELKKKGLIKTIEYTQVAIKRKTDKSKSKPKA